MASPSLAGRGFSGIATDDTTNIVSSTKPRPIAWGGAIRSAERIAPALFVLGVVKDYHYASLRFGIEPMLLFPMPRTPQASRAYNSCRSNYPEKRLQKRCKRSRQRMNEFFRAMCSNTIFMMRRLSGSIAMSCAWQKRSAISRSRYFHFAARTGRTRFLHGRTAHQGDRRSQSTWDHRLQALSFCSVRNSANGLFWRAMIAWPIGYFVMKNWLQTFAYRSEIGWRFSADRSARPGAGACNRGLSVDQGGTGGSGEIAAL